MKLIFKDPRLKKQIFHLLIPFVLQELVIVFTTLMSNFVLKWWGCASAVTTGIANAFQIFFIYNSTMCGVCYVANLFMSQHYGRGDLESVERDYYIVMKIALAIGFIFFILAEAIPSQLLFFDSNPISHEYGVQYLRWFAPVFLLIAPTLINYSLMKNTHLEKYCAISSAITFAVAFVLEASLMFGINIEHLALEFAAGSMVIARLVEFMFCFIVINKKCTVKFKFKRLFKSDLERFKSVVHYGSPMIISKLSWALGVAFITVFTNMYLLKNIIVAHSLMITYQNIVACLSNALASVVAVIIGRELGANRIQKAKDHGTEISRFLFLMGIVEMALLMLFLPLTIATTAPSTLKDAGDYLWKVFVIQLVAMMPRSYNSSYINGLLNAGGDTIYIMLSDGITAWITIVPIAFIGTHFNWNPLLIYALLQLEEVFKFPFNVWRYKTKKWAKNITNKKGIVFNE